MWTLTLCGGRDPLPVMVSWEKRPSKAQVDPYRKQWRGYRVVVHKLGARAVCRRKMGMRTT